MKLLNIMFATIAISIAMITAAKASAEVPEESIYNISSKFLNTSGQEVSLSELQGHPVVISMAYTRCTYTCPLILSQMQQLEKELQKREIKDVRFVLVSFDPQNDTPQSLQKYMEKKKLGSDWRLYTGKSDKSLREIANVLGIKYKKVEDGYFDHSFIITVLDNNGVIRGQQVGADKDPKDLVKFIKGP
ncbi:MAG TPA: SCO family protein [Bdellovibrio sp.]|uniref:SCO family protein n=1 Tax=Bdellovibrio sp. TaxID=28201 RepID=UPI002F115873